MSIDVFIHMFASPGVDIDPHLRGLCALGVVNLGLFPANDSETLAGITQLDRARHAHSFEILNFFFRIHDRRSRSHVPLYNLARAAVGIKFTCLS